MEHAEDQSLRAASKVKANRDPFRMIFTEIKGLFRMFLLLFASNFFASTENETETLFFRPSLHCHS
jgi:hypothetical protein